MKVAVPLNENIHKDDSSLSDGLSHLHQAVTTIWIFFFLFPESHITCLEQNICSSLPSVYSGCRAVRY